MAEYIERKAFKNNLMTAMINKTADGDALAMKLGMLMCDLADCEPAADVAPVVHGKWTVTVKPIGESVQRRFINTCSVCGGKVEFLYRAHRYEYCPHCGAVMGGGKKG